MAVQTPSMANAFRTGYAPDPAEDGNVPALRRVFSAAKWVGLINEVLALQAALFVPVYNDTGGDLAAGPLSLTSYYDGRGYLVNGTFGQGASTINVDTGTRPINIGSVFTFDGLSQVFTSTVALTGAGALAFTPPLPAGLVNNTPLTIDAGVKVALAASPLQAHVIVAAVLPDKTAGVGYAQAIFLSALDTSGAAVGDPVYLDPLSGAMTLALPSSPTSYIQIVAFVATVANPGIVAGQILPPSKIGRYQLVDGVITDVKVDAAAAIAGTKIVADFGSQIVSTNLQYWVNGDIVVSARQTGWSISSFTAVHTDLDPLTATVQDAVKSINAIIHDLQTHGLIGI